MYVVTEGLYELKKTFNDDGNFALNSYEKKKYYFVTLRKEKYNISN